MVLLWFDCRAQAANWLTLKKTVFPDWKCGNKGNRMLLSGLAHAKIKEYSWLRVSTPHFLVHHCAFDHSFFFSASVWKQGGQLLTYFFFCQLVVNDFPLHGCGACCLLFDARTASTGCSTQARHLHNTWMRLIVSFSAFLDGWAHVNKEIVVSKTVLLMSRLRYAIWSIWWLSH